LYADDLVVIAKTEEDLVKRLNEWKNNVENTGMRVNKKNKASIRGQDSVSSISGYWPTSEPNAG